MAESATVAEALIELRMDRSQLQSDMEGVAGQMRGAGGRSATEWLRGFSNTSRTAGRLINMAALPLATALGASVRAFSKTSEGAGLRDSMKDLGNSFAEFGGKVSKTPVLGRSLQEWIESLSKALRGFDQKQVDLVVKGVLSLAAAGAALRVASMGFRLIGNLQSLGSLSRGGSMGRGGMGGSGWGQTATVAGVEAASAAGLAYGLSTMSNLQKAQEAMSSLHSANTFLERLVVNMPAAMLAGQGSMSIRKYDEMAATQKKLAGIQDRITDEETTRASNYIAKAGKSSIRKEEALAVYGGTKVQTLARGTAVAVAIGSVVLAIDQLSRLNYKETVRWIDSLGMGIGTFARIVRDAAKDFPSDISKTFSGITEALGRKMGGAKEGWGQAFWAGYEDWGAKPWQPDAHAMGKMALQRFKGRLDPYEMLGQPYKDLMDQWQNKTMPAIEARDKIHKLINAAGYTEEEFQDLENGHADYMKNKREEKIKKDEILIDLARRSAEKEAEYAEAKYDHELELSRKGDEVSRLYTDLDRKMADEGESTGVRLGDMQEDIWKVVGKASRMGYTGEKVDVTGVGDFSTRMQVQYRERMESANEQILEIQKDMRRMQAEYNKDMQRGWEDLYENENKMAEETSDLNRRFERYAAEFEKFKSMMFEERNKVSME